MECHDRHWEVLLSGCSRVNRRAHGTTLSALVPDREHREAEPGHKEEQHEATHARASLSLKT